MTTEITASLVVDFRDPNETGADGAGPDALLSVELDGRPSGLNGGRSIIRPGDPVYYLIYKTDNVTITEQITTAGGISAAGAGLLSVGASDDPLYLDFVDTDERTLSKPIAGSFSASWVGANRGDVAQVSQIRLRTQQKVVGVLRTQYQAQYSAYLLSNVPTNVGRVIVFVRGEYG